MKTNDWTLFGARRYHCTGISMRCQDYGPIRAFQGGVERGNIIRQGGQWYWSRQDIQRLDCSGPVMSFQLEPSAHAP
jgi:hypothetical protein